MDYADFTIPYIIDSITNSPADNKLTTQADDKSGIIHINGEEAITFKLTLDEIHIYRTQCSKSKVNISLYISKRYYQTDIE